LLPLLGSTSSLGSRSFLTDLFAESSRESAARNQRTRLLAYPLLILAASLAVFLILIVLVVPTFISVFDDFELPLPSLTVLIVRLSETIRFHFGQALLVVASFVAAAYVLYRLLKALRFPGRVFDALTKGSSRQLTIMAAFVRRLAELLKTGLSLPTACALPAKRARELGCGTKPPRWPIVSNTIRPKATDLRGQRVCRLRSPTHSTPVLMASRTFGCFKRWRRSIQSESIIG
jgi:hypothetical protein